MRVLHAALLAFASARGCIQVAMMGDSNTRGYAPSVIPRRKQTPEGLTRAAATPRRPASRIVRRGEAPDRPWQPPDRPWRLGRGERRTVCPQWLDSSSRAGKNRIQAKLAKNWATGGA